ncbi:MAG TPA: 3'-5' exoribonuclease, partial [Flavobacterium sp.]|nr:3'-5' exoribonuclease [Flavobacterium sp.]
MKYFIDTEFLEGPQKESFPISLFRKQTPNTIDLISIGIVAEDGREFYAISKDFNLKEAWNRFDWKHDLGSEPKKVYWLRENVLFPIFKELYNTSVQDDKFIKNHFSYAGTGFSFGHFQALIKYYGKTNKQIAKEVKDFCRWKSVYNELTEITTHFQDTNPEFYAYYADYDWVVFCW